MFHFYTLGRLELTTEDGGAIQSVLAQPKRVALLAYLAAARPRGFHRRDSVIGQFWPDVEEDRARNSLRQALYFLRRSLGEEVLVGRGDEEVGIAEEHFWCDAGTFEELLDAGKVEEALELYRGDFLEGFYVSEAGEFERWMAGERQRLRERAVAAAWEQSVRREMAGDGAAALRWAQWAMERDPHSEAGVQQLIALQDRQGDRAGALRTYEEFAVRLQRELEVDPSAETKALLAEIRSRETSIAGAAVRERTADPNGGARDAAVAAAQRAAPEVPAAVAAAAAPNPHVPEVAQRPRKPPFDGDALATNPPFTIPLHNPWLQLVFLIVLGIAGGAWLSRDPGLVLPEPAARELPSTEDVLVLPFALQSENGASYLSEAMVPALGANLDRAGSLISINPNAALAYARRTGLNGPIDPTRANEVAGRFGAEYFVLGSILEAGGRLRVRASLYATGRQPTIVAEGSADAGSADLFGVSDVLARDLLAGLHARPLGHFARLAALTTPSFPALKSYLEGENARRSGQMPWALDAFRRAVAADSGFALAHYRLAVVAEGLGEFDLAHSSAEAAVRLATPDDVPEQDRTLFQAFALERRGEVAEAERLYRVVMAAQPNELEARYMWGRLVFRYGPVLGRSPAETREAFQRVLEIDPAHVPALAHLIQIALLEGDDAQADSLHALDPAVEALVPLRVLRAFGNGDWERAEGFLAALAQAGDVPLYLTVRKIATLTQDPAHAGRLAEFLTRPERSPAGQLLGHITSAELALAQGRWRAAEAELAAAARVSPTAALKTRAFLAAMPFVSVPPAELRALRARLGAAAEDGVDLDSPAIEAALGRLGPATRSYLVGLLSVRLSDLAAAERSLAELEGGLADQQDAVGLAGSLRAQIAWAQSRPADALAALEGVATAPPLELLWLSPTHSRALDRFTRAELLRALGRPDEALNWYASLGLATAHDLVFRGPAHLRGGEVMEQAGRSEAAADHYAAFVELWSDADPQFRPMVDRARQALDRLRTN